MRERAILDVHLPIHSCQLDHSEVLQHSRKYDFLSGFPFLLLCCSAALSLSLLRPLIIFSLNPVVVLFCFIWIFCCASVCAFHCKEDLQVQYVTCKITQVSVIGPAFFFAACHMSAFLVNSLMSDR